MDVNASRKESSISPSGLKQLKLHGKKYAYDLRQKNSRSETEQLNYLPSQPNITPHYLLFGSDREEIFKKVFQQIVHKLK